MRLFIWLSMNPSQRLKVTQVLMIRKLRWQRHIGVGANLWHQDHASNFLHLWIVWWRDTIEICRNLGAKITDADERLEDVFWHHIRVASFTNILAVDIQVIGTEMEGSCTDCPDTPLCP